jgi:hypothetical protein
VADRAVCQMCSWFGKSGPGRAWATWHWTFVDGTSQLLCGRHKAQAMRAGGFGQPIDQLRGLVVAPPRMDQSVAGAAKPLTILDQVLHGLRPLVEQVLRQYIRSAVLRVDFEDQQGARRQAS